jgi:putative acetyltransferase
LIDALNEELTNRYPDPGDNHFGLTADEVEEGDGMFLVAWDGAQPVGCGALRRYDDTSGEIKRMYVAPENRGLGIGHRILSELEEGARSLRMSRVLLETGVYQPEALALYVRCGFNRIPCFGEYASSPRSICMEKVFDPAPEDPSN